MQATIKLDPRQAWQAQVLWAQVCRTVERLETDRRQLLSNLSSADSQVLTSQKPIETHLRIRRAMGIAAQLGENEKLQQAAVRRACRIFTWQICSPDNGARLICTSSPYGPDLTAALRAVAAMPSAPQ